MFEAVWWVVLSWRDARAPAVVEQATASAMAPGGSCGRPCDSGGLATMGCCDGIWMPHMEMPNLLSFADDQQPRYRINANTSSGVVTWRTRIVGTWSAPLDYRAYPFDHQHLLLELSIHDSQAGAAGLKWERVDKLNNTAHTKGPDFSGWNLVSMRAKIYDSRTCYQQYDVAEPRYAAPDGRYESVRLADRRVSDNRIAGSSSPDGCGSHGGESYEEARALYGPIVLVADFMVKRVASYYLLTNVVPVLIMTLVTFVVFFMPHDALGDRMSVVLTMFLSLTAMQFVFDFPPANYMNALQMVPRDAGARGGLVGDGREGLTEAGQRFSVRRTTHDITNGIPQVVLVSYILITLACVECLLVNRLVTVAELLSNERACAPKYSGLVEDARFERYLLKELLGSRATRSHASRVRLLRTVGSRQRRTAGAVGSSGGDGGSDNGHASGAGDKPAAGPAVGGDSSRGEALCALSNAGSLRPAESTGAGNGGGLGGLGGGASSHGPVLDPATDVKSHGVRALLQRCRSLGVRGTLRALTAAAWQWLVATVCAPLRVYLHCREDHEFALFVANRIDWWTCVISVSFYAVIITVLLWVQSEVGDHRLMLGNRPGNM
ncbi:hypothetical protein GPECTOR_51g701 [Gonium pectorale]|uniref:Neurotransmitter-gated ion-channel ligand-binding domain-containing protein n=1 Tax=Gonium pectorale TaxID=33097 RepID=A0A150G830_GONPE|nr:hypothetical protein GPECTOR_51g701 [Gonium pectorale]|eukprot:KXZ45715.1 hypothetical protein GPECTOR_51g701 [Gonium pectorale]